ncbi:MAG: hypothetical protein BJ554DRAFT_516 [Olpidium bornovanus]|uniref:Uncharacterized protein n=1 Tax=Olpidium bornovanus TaxID=278681 RepID=A0A8H7ZTL7_9FUNG|nr:MAG: hypothetical protein BJ554DRAFT_516 [Olpidium bornovanus]
MLGFSSRSFIRASNWRSTDPAVATFCQTYRRRVEPEEDAARRDEEQRRLSVFVATEKALLNGYRSPILEHGAEERGEPLRAGAAPPFFVSYPTPSPPVPHARTGGGETG